MNNLAQPRTRKTIWVSYLVFLASIVLISSIYLGWLLVQAVSPTVTFSRTNAEVTATVEAPEGYEVKYFTNSQAETHIHYSQVVNSQSCSAQGFGTTRLADWDNVANQATFTATLGVGHSYYCLKVLYQRPNNDASTKEYYALFTIDQQAPVVAVKQQANNLVATADDISQIATWEVLISDTAVSDCSAESGSFTEQNVATTKTLIMPLSDGNHGKYYCFKLTDDQGNVGYNTAGFQVDTRSPQLSVNQNNAILTVSVFQDDNNDSQPDSNANINLDSWQYATISASKCNSRYTSFKDLDTFKGAVISRDRAVITLTQSTAGRTYCFRVADNVGHYAYSHVSATTINNPPTLSGLQQSRLTVKANAYDAVEVDGNSWQYVIETDDDCHSQLTGWSSVGLTLENRSTTKRSYTIIDLTDTGADEDVEDQWLCLRVADSLVGNYAYKSIKIDVVAPTIKLRQTNNLLWATSPSKDRPQSSTWRWVEDEDDLECDEDTFEDLTVNRGSQIRLDSNDVNDYFCFKVEDQYGNVGYSDAYHVTSLNTATPTISMTQKGSVLTVQVSNNVAIDKDSWRYARVSRTNQPSNCRTVAPNLTWRSFDDQTLNLVEDDINYWFCFRVLNNLDFFGYGKIRIKTFDATAPVVEVGQKGSTLTATTKATDINVNSWQYARSQVNDDFDCDKDLSFNRANSQNNTVTLSESDSDRYYCFRVADKAGNYGYAKSNQITTIDNPPTLKVIQKSQARVIEVSTTADDVDGYSWAWATFSSDPGDCSKVTYTDVNTNLLTSSTQKIVISNISDTQHGAYYCFRVADTSSQAGNTRNYGYAKYRYDLSTPVIGFKFNDTANILTINSSSTDVDHDTWQYAKFSQSVDCQTYSNSLITRLPANRQLLLREVDNNHWLCFKVADYAGNYIYALYSVGKVDDQSSPVITLETPAGRIIARSTSANVNYSTWAWALSLTEPYCGPNSNLQFVKNHNNSLELNLQVKNLGSAYHWLCFKVSNQRGLTTYSKIRIDRQAPTIKITQNNILLTIESTDDDLDATTWGYFYSKTQLDCQREDLTFDKLNQVESSEISFDVTTHDSDFIYYCFRVADKHGNYGYKGIVLNEINLEAPVISLTLRNTTLTASADNVDDNTWQWLRSRTDIDCSPDNQLEFSEASKSAHKLILNESSNGYWYCFKVVADNGIVGYAKIFVTGIDTKAPQVTVKQTAETIMATSDEDVKNWQYVVLKDNQACDYRAFRNSSLVKSGNEVNLNQASSGAVYCFRVADAKGNYTYESLTVSLDTAAQPESTQPSSEEKPTDEAETTESTPADEEETDNQDLILIIGGALVALLIVTLIFLALSKKHHRNDSSNGGLDDHDSSSDLDYV
ncbi:MAG: hypothetical protein OXF85_00850 [Candidatus Saccharibacteria bacterium]|nr:hypothetical protein [Candidatus Saccharibacteria bacterium]